MKLHLLASAAFLSLGALLPPASPANAEGKCVNVLGFESDGMKQTMDPAAMIGTDSVYHVRAVYEPLVDRTSTMKPVPALAESWESNAVSPGGFSTLAFLDSAGIWAVDNQTVKFKVKSPVVELPLLIATKYALMVPDGAKAEDLQLKGDGTGPFMQETFEINGPIRVLRRNPDYWRAGLPKADCLRITTSLEPTSRLPALLSGSVDLSLLVDPTNLVTLKDNPAVDLVETKGATSLYMAVWTDTPPFDDVRVREALKLVMDRQTIQLHCPMVQYDDCAVRN